MLLSDFRRGGSSFFKLRFLVAHTLCACSSPPVFGERSDRSNGRRLCLWFTGQKTRSREIQMWKWTKKIWRIEGVDFFFPLDSFEQCTMHGIKKKRGEEKKERGTAVIKTVAIRWMVFIIRGNAGRKRKLLVGHSLRPIATGSRIRSFVRKNWKALARQCDVSSRR